MMRTSLLEEVVAASTASKVMSARLLTWAVVLVRVGAIMVGWMDGDRVGRGRQMGLSWVVRKAVGAKAA